MRAVPALRVVGTATCARPQRRRVRAGAGDEMFDERQHPLDDSNAVARDAGGRRRRRLPADDPAGAPPRRRCRASSPRSSCSSAGCCARAALAEHVAPAAHRRDRDRVEGGARRGSSSATTASSSRRSLLGSRARSPRRAAAAERPAAGDPVEDRCVERPAPDPRSSGAYGDPLSIIGRLDRHRPQAVRRAITPSSTSRRRPGRAHVLVPAPRRRHRWATAREP